MTSSTPNKFIRDRVTWLLYFMLAFFAYTQATLGPAMPFLGDELHLSYTVRGFHFSAFALGMVTAGLSADRLSRIIGRQRLFWLGGLGMAIGAVLFIVFKRAELTIASSLILGALGGQMLVVIQAALADRHGEWRAVAFSESNLAASIGASLAPLLVGGFQRIGVGWRGAVVAGALYWLTLGGLFRNDALPRVQSDDVEIDVSAARLPAVYWAYALVLFLGAAIEWSMIFWGTDFLENGIGLQRNNAAAAMAVFFAAILIGRATGSGLARRFPAPRLLLAAYGVVVVGFFPFWLARWVPLNLLGLFIAGIGVANLFPLCLSVAISVVPPHLSDAASGRVSFSTGSAILIVPQILGSLADQVGISNAFGVVAVLSVVAMGVMFRAGQMRLTDE